MSPSSQFVQHMQLEKCQTNKHSTRRAFLAEFHAVDRCIRRSILSDAICDDAVESAISAPQVRRPRSVMNACYVPHRRRRLYRSLNAFVRVIKEGR